MYTRIEIMEEERLDWGIIPEPHLKDMNVKITEYEITPMFKRIQMFLDRSFDFVRENSNINKLTHFLDKNLELSLLFSIVSLPYIVGSCISYFLFYYYGGMPIESFIGLNQNHISLEMWSMGAYLFITIWVFWIILTP